MASTSLASSSTPNNFRYDVFPSFRGKDIRDAFAGHLYAALDRAGIVTFWDENKIERGELLEDEIRQAIIEAKAYIVVLSENYANSRWCLDELTLILEQRRKFNRFVLPVFYHVEPSDVRNQRNSFAIEVKMGSKWTMDNVNRWKASLAEVANLAGMTLIGSETEFISKIVEKIDFKLDIKLVSTAAHLTGMDIRAEGVNSWLKNDQSDVVAVCGMGGSGKTTLALHIYEANKHEFESSSFLEVTGNQYKPPRDLRELQNQILMDILDGKNTKISSVSEGTSKIQVALQRKKVLIVLDDIDDHDRYLSALLGERPSYTQSKIIITTRHLDVRSWFQSMSWRYQLQRLELLNDDESLELLSFHAFGSKIPMEGLEKLAVQLAKYCEGNPLALKILGSSLFVTDEDSQNRDSTIGIWRSTLNSLNSLKGDLDCKIQGILQRSFDSLPRDSHRELFLDIAFFFVGEYEDYVVKILEGDRHAKSGIKILINRCLLTVSPSSKLMMHQLLQEMGRKIVLERSRNPAKRSRVSHDDDSYHLLKNREGSKTLEGLALDMEKLKRRMRSKPLPIKTDSFAKMNKLKFLQLKYVELTGASMNFPELRWLCWHGCHLKTIHSGLLMSNLVAIDMSDGNLEKFEPPMVLSSLKILNLKGSCNLVSICNLDRLPNLEELILWNCSRLTNVCETLGDLKSLALLDLSGCQNLWRTPSYKDFVNQLKNPMGSCFSRGVAPVPLFSLPVSLKFLFLNNLNFPHNDDKDAPLLFSHQTFLHMNLGNNRFKSLPNYIDLKTLRVLELTACPNLKSLLCLPSTLEELYTYRCGSLEKITFQSARFRLREFGYEGCFKLSEVQGLFKLVPVEKLDLEDLGPINWIKAYRHRKVDLVGDVITNHRDSLIQVLYEYGITSTYLPGYIKEKDEQRGIFSYLFPSPSSSFSVPLCRRLAGLTVVVVYRLSGEEDDKLALFMKISNKTRGRNRTWIYNPVVVCKPKVGEDVTWSSYWPIGNMFSTGDVVEVSIIVGNGLMVSESGACFWGRGWREEPENMENNTTEEEVVGGNLSYFELSRKGWYYLSRRDFFNSMTLDWLRTLDDTTTECSDIVKELQGWKRSRRSPHLKTSFMELKTFRDVPMEGKIGPFWG